MGVISFIYSIYPSYWDAIRMSLGCVAFGGPMILFGPTVAFMLIAGPIAILCVIYHMSATLIKYGAHDGWRRLLGAKSTSTPMSAPPLPPPSEPDPITRDDVISFCLALLCIGAHFTYHILLSDESRLTVDIYEWVVRKNIKRAIVYIGVVIRGAKLW